MEQVAFGLPVHRDDLDLCRIQIQRIGTSQSHLVLDLRRPQGRPGRLRCRWSSLLCLL